MVNGEPDPEPSVDLARLTTLDECQARRPGCGIGKIEARVPLDLGFAVLHRPLPDNPAHAVLRGENTRGRCAALATETVRAPQ